MLPPKIIELLSASSQWIIKRIFGSPVLPKYDSNENIFKALTPTINADPDGVYEKALLYALDNPAIKNIALTGGYGAGKSSVIATFFHKHNALQPVQISLATFGYDESSKPGEKNKTQSDDDIQLIERSILQQLFYSVPQHVIPLSRFKRITSPDTYTLVQHALYSSIFVFTIWCFFHGGNPTLKIPFSNNSPELPLHSFYIVFNFAMLLCFSFVTSVFLVKKGWSISELKMKFHTAEIAVDRSKRGESVLNHHLDEILYFFQQTGCNIVVIEDLDRFKTSEIFIRLRELNLMLNSNDEISKPIKFIYAVKDEIFHDTDRTKFFDFIIPIIPIVNPTNSYDFIKKNYININDVDDNLLRKVSLYFDDLRLVQNIFNEYQIYAEKQKDLTLDANKLLALIIFKNFHPQDFSGLHYRKGTVHKIFNEWKLATQSSIAQAQHDQIKSIEEQKHHSIRERQTSISELNRIYGGEIARKLLEASSNSTLNIEGAQVNAMNFLNGNYVEKFAELGSAPWNNSQQYNVSSLYFDKIETSIGADRSYQQRKQAIEEKNKQSIDESDDAIRILRKDVQDIYDCSVRELLANPMCPPSIPTPSPLTTFLLREAFIEEDYDAYISHFFPSLIDIHDKNYILLINSRGRPSFTAPISNAENILKHYVSSSSYSHHSVLNYKMADFLFGKEQSGYDEYQEELMFQLCSSSLLPRDFIRTYIVRGINTENFVILLAQYWPEFAEYYAQIEDHVVLELVLKHVPIHVLAPPDKFKKLCTFIANTPKPLSFLKNAFDSDSEIITLIKHLNIELKNLDLPEGGVSFFKEICAHQLYEINHHNMREIMGAYEIDPKRIDDFISMPFNTIKNTNITFLEERIFSDLDYSVCCLVSGIRLDEPQEIFIEILNRCIKEATQIRLISNWISKINDITAINSELHSLLMSKEKVQASWKNVIAYMRAHNFEIDESMANFLNIKETYLLLANDAPGKLTEDDAWLSAWETIIDTNSLSDSAYSALLPQCTFVWDNVLVEELSESKLSELINLRKLKFTSEILIPLKRKCQNLVAPYLYSLVEEVSMSSDDLFELLDIDDLELIVETNLNVKIKEHLIQRINIEIFADSELLCAAAIHTFSGKLMPKQLFDGLYSRLSSREKKMEILCDQFKYLPLQQVAQLLSDLRSDFIGFFDNLQSKLISSNKENDSIVSALESAGLINTPEKLNANRNNGERIKLKPIRKLA